MIGANTYISSDGRILIFLNFGGIDKYEVVSGIPLSGPDVAGFSVSTGVMTLDDSTTMALSTDALPLTPPAPAAFDTHLLKLEFEVFS